MNKMGQVKNEWDNPVTGKALSEDYKKKEEDYKK